MHLYVAITDSDWYSFLSATSPDEVNFWQPSGGAQFKALSPGEPLLFKLHSPMNYIVGGGFFSHFSVVPVSFAWKTFGVKNGAPTEQEMRARIEHYRRVRPNPAEDYFIGCILLQSPFFLPKQDWIPVDDWHRSIVRGKGYETDEQSGRVLWEQIQARLGRNPLNEILAPQIKSPRFGEPLLILPRLGQGAFRVIVTDNYGRRCAFTKSPVLHVLDAAHIKPYALGGTHSPTNGILMRQDMHTLFDRGYLTVDANDHRITVSRHIKEEFDNGKEYYALHGQLITLPKSSETRPEHNVLDWHNQNIYRD